MNFDDKAKEWDKDPSRVERARLFAGEILKFTGDKGAGSALEFGSGTGLVSFQLKERFTTVTLADTSTGMMEVLENKIRLEKLTNFRPFLIKDLADLLSLSPMDVIFTLLTLHHVKDIDAAFGAFRSVLRPGGYLFIGDLVTEDGSFHSRDPEFDGHRGFDTGKLKLMLLEAGFECIEDKVFHNIVRENDGILKNYPLFILVLKKR
jgi:SAM-dependent methyltransferase